MWIKAKIEKEKDGYYLRHYCSSNKELIRVTVHTKTRKLLEPGFIILSVDRRNKVRPIRRTANKTVTKEFFTRIMKLHQEVRGEIVLIYKTCRHFDSKIEFVWGCSKIKASNEFKYLDAYYNKLYKTIFKDAQWGDNV